MAHIMYYVCRCYIHLADPLKTAFLGVQKRFQQRHAARLARRRSTIDTHAAANHVRTSCLARCSRVNVGGPRPSTHVGYVCTTVVYLFQCNLQATPCFGQDVLPNAKPAFLFLARWQASNLGFAMHFSRCCTCTPGRRAKRYRCHYHGLLLQARCATPSMKVVLPVMANYASGSLLPNSRQWRPAATGQGRS